MPKQQTDHLLQLILSLTKAEKRHFRLFVRRNQSSDEILFLQLFDCLDRYKEYDEALILRKLPQVKKRQLSNLKAHLYKQLLISLRLLNKSNNADMEIRERIDYARVLYNKGLYRPSLDILAKVKAKALQIQQHTLAIEILEFEKLIESQYITRSIDTRSEELSQEALILTSFSTKRNAYSNLALKMYGLYLKTGYVRNEQDFQSVQAFFQEQLPAYHEEELDFYGKIYLYQSYHWYFFITQDFLQGYRYAQRWLDLFEHNPQMISIEAPLYLKGLHYLLNTLFNLWHYHKFMLVLAILEQFPQVFSLQQDRNIEGLFYQYLYSHQIKRHYLEGTYSEGLHLVQPLMQIVEEDEYGWDYHRIMVFYYRIACLYFGSGDYGTAIDYLNRIINEKTPDFREDIQCFARILNLIAHYELGNAQLLEYQVKSVYRFLLKMEDMHMVQQAIFKFLRQLPTIQPQDLKEAFIDLKKKLETIRKYPFERRPFLYLDITSWLDSKIQNRPIQEIVHEKFQKSESIID